MKLREKITEIILQNSYVVLDGGLHLQVAPYDANLASKKILEHLNLLLDLDGNGWFDNDKEMSEFVNR